MVTLCKNAVLVQAEMRNPLLSAQYHGRLCFVFPVEVVGHGGWCEISHAPSCWIIGSFINYVMRDAAFCDKHLPTPAFASCSMFFGFGRVTVFFLANFQGI